MPERWLGLTVGSDKVTLVVASVPDQGAIEIVHDLTWQLQKGDRPTAYDVMHGRVLDYVRENEIARAVIKASAVSLAGTKKTHLQAAELRGVVMSALAKSTSVQCETKAHISKNFGDRKADEYLKDSEFWAAQVTGDLRVGSREAAFLILAARP